jgi:hypothetical protein
MDTVSLTRAREKTLAGTALELAQTFLDAHRHELATQAAGDRGALIGALKFVRSAPGDGGASKHQAEHVAFTLLCTALADLPRQGKPVTPICADLLATGPIPDRR